MLIDTHIHLYEEEFKSDLNEVISRAKQNGVQKMIMPNVDGSSVASMLDIAKGYPENCFPMIGLHPCYVKEDFRIQLEQIKQELDSGKYVAVGEIGLDLYWDKTGFEAQKEAFICQVNWAKEKHLPIAIHSREATQEAIRLLQPLACSSLTGVFHCFGGTLEQAREAIDMGFYLGIGGVVTFKNAQLDKILKDIPLENLVLETDGPYLAPVPFRGKRNESAYLTYVVKKLAEIYGISFEEIARVTSENAEKLFAV